MEKTLEKTYFVNQVLVFQQTNNFIVYGRDRPAAGKINLLSSAYSPYCNFPNIDDTHFSSPNLLPSTCGYSLPVPLRHTLCVYLGSYPASHSPSTPTLT